MKTDIRLPKEFEDRMRRQVGVWFDTFAESLQQPAPVSIRINPHKHSKQTGEKIPWTQFGKYLPERPVFTLDPSLHAGAYYVQEASSMLLELALTQTTDLSNSLRVLDLSAAPGGKSTHVLSLLSQDSLLVSNEVIRSRASILSENIQKWGHGNVIVTNNDPESFKQLHGYFDVIVVDAPCSGEGLFRKDPDAMNEWSQENINLCALRQQRIVNDVWPALKEDGVLIYSTCTYNEKENEDNLVWLSQQHNVEFIPLAIDSSWGVEEIKKNKTIGYRCYPHKVKGEGFFISVIRKKEQEKSLRTKSKRGFTEAPKKVTEQLGAWIKDSAAFRVIKQDDLLIQIPRSMYEEVEFLCSALHIVSKGTAIAELKHEKLVPEHAFALSIHCNTDNFPSYELTLEEALSYLRKENLMIGEGKRGFALVTYQGNSLGWVNLLGNRVNNLYPSNWRIRLSS